jgi:saccharopine dehydrogenase-like NADP-dependent oxidoreductase
MRNVLVIGAGRSAVYLLDYLFEHASANEWKITVADADPVSARKLLGNLVDANVLALDATDDAARRELISKSDLVISMLPAFMHIAVAKDCLHFKKHLVTPSYISKEMREMEPAVEKAGLVFLNELGVDPGIDHMSAMRLLDSMRKRGAEITWFESFTGGLVAPQSDDNPWNYKFTWNPRNVVLAGQGGAVKFKHNGRFKYIPYQKLFRRTEIIEIPGHGRFEGYANRDSLNYRELYGLTGVPTIYRGTLRRVGFCRAWDIFVQMGMTDDSYLMEDWRNMTHRQFTNCFLAYSPDDSVELKLMHYMKLDQDSDLIEKLRWIGIFDDEPIGIDKPATPAQMLQHILEKKWTLRPGDKDMIVMWHKMQSREKGEDHEREWHSSMVVIGESAPRTAMAKTVGLPVAIAAKMILQGKFSKPGVHMPVDPELYLPILEELETYGISFKEVEIKTGVVKN